MKPETDTVFADIQRIENAADQLRAMRINVMSIYEAIDTKIDVERLLRRLAKDMKQRQAPDLRLV